MKPHIELVTTGAELLNGSVLNGHTQWLGGQLFALGWELTRDTTVSDSLADIHEALSSALARSDVVLVTGGLGPTSDDRTRDAAAKWVGAGIVMHEPTREKVIRIYRRLNKPLNSTTERHALIVEGAEVLENNHGMAAGQYLRKDGKHLFLLPGPPSEFQGVMRDHVLPLLASLVPSAPVRTHIFQIAGLGESDIAAKIEEAGVSASNLDVSYCARPGNVSVRLRQIEDDEAAFNGAVSLIRDALTPAVYAEADEPVEVTLGRMLTERGLTLAVAESCTGGMIGSRITSVSGSSAYMRGGVISYDNEVKETLLGVNAETLRKHGAVSAPVAEAMARGVREAARADIGISVTGIAGPDGGTEEKPVGLVYIGLSDADGTLCRKFRMGGNRDGIRMSSATRAMDLVRRRLQGLE